MIHQKAGIGNQESGLGIAKTPWKYGASDKTRFVTYSGATFSHTVCIWSPDRQCFCATLTSDLGSDKYPTEQEAIDWFVAWVNAGRPGDMREGGLAATPEYVRWRDSYRGAKAS